MRPTVSPTLRFFSLVAGLPVVATIFSPLAAEALAIPPRADRVANRVAERRYARMSIAEARAARAEARVAEIAPAVPVPPPPRPATVRRMARAGVPLGGPTPPAIAAAPAPLAPRSLAVRQPLASPSARYPATAAAPAPAAVVNRAAPAAATESGAWTLDSDQGVSPTAATAAPDGARSVLKAGGDPPAQPPAATPSPRPSGPAITQPPIELLPTPNSR